MLDYPFPTPAWTSINWTRQPDGSLKVRSGDFHFIASRHPHDKTKVATKLDREVYPDFLRWPPEVEIRYAKFHQILGVIWEGTFQKILGERPPEELQQ